MVAEISRQDDVLAGAEAAAITGRDQHQGREASRPTVGQEESLSSGQHSWHSCGPTGPGCISGWQQPPAVLCHLQEAGLECRDVRLEESRRTAEAVVRLATRQRCVAFVYAAFNYVKLG